MRQINRSSDVSEPGLVPYDLNKTIAETFQVHSRKCDHFLIINVEFMLLCCDYLVFLVNELQFLRLSLASGLIKDEAQKSELGLLEAKRRRDDALDALAKMSSV